MTDTASLFSWAELEAAAQLVHRTVPPTPQYAWLRLAELVGEVWVKHENHTPTGAFKVRGGIVYMDALARSGERVPGVITATGGNHGQSIAFAAARANLPATIYVPHGNAADQNAAMRAFGATVVEFGKDFDDVSEAGALATMARGPQGRLGAATTADRNAAPSIRPQSERRGIWNKSGLRPRRSKLPHACQRLARGEACATPRLKTAPGR
jgi:threonine synthase